MMMSSKSSALASRSRRLVHRVGLGERLLEAVRGLAREGLLVDQLVLQVGDLGAERLRRELLGVQVEVAADQRHQALGVGRVVDRERRGEAELLRLAAQDPHAGAVEGQTHIALARGADQLLDALLHLARGLVGEGDREDLAGVHAAGRQQVGDAVGEHPGLAGAGAGHDEQRASPHAPRRRAAVRSAPPGGPRRRSRDAGRRRGSTRRGPRARRTGPRTGRPAPLRVRATPRAAAGAPPREGWRSARKLSSKRLLIVSRV